MLVLYQYIDQYCRDINYVIVIKIWSDQTYLYLRDAMLYIINYLMTIWNVNHPF